MPLVLNVPISNNFQLNGASGETIKLWALHCCDSQSLIHSPEAPFNWKLLLIDTVNAKGI